MTKYLIIYSTTDGQTKKICEKISDKINHNDTFDMSSLEMIDDTDINLYDKIILGASIRYGKHNPNLYEFIRNNIDILNKKFTVFFSVNVVARKEKKNTPDTNPYMKKFLKLSSWHPDVLGVFAGKIDYPKYKFLDRQIIRFIMYITGGPTDISKAYEFTNWEDVEKFTKKIF